MFESTAPSSIGNHSTTKGRNWPIIEPLIVFNILPASTYPTTLDVNLTIDRRPTYKRAGPEKERHSMCVHRGDNLSGILFFFFLQDRGVTLAYNII